MNETDPLTGADRVWAIAAIAAVLAVFAVAVWFLYRLALWAVVALYGERWGIQQRSFFARPEPLEDPP